MIEYNHSLIVNVSRRLVLAWGTHSLVCEEMTGNMANVVLPTKDEIEVKLLQEELDRDYNIYVVYQSIPSTVATDPEVDVGGIHDSRVFFLRLSAQIYLEADDFVALETLVPMLLQRARARATIVRS
jgi:hypothetical protein